MKTTRVTLIFRANAENCALAHRLNNWLLDNRLPGFSTTAVSMWDMAEQNGEEVQALALIFDAIGSVWPPLLEFYKSLDWQDSHLIAVDATALAESSWFTA